ncbi:MAG: ribbon-helix-helix protein, CopG family [Desulfovibrio sp.]|jgi:predicted transcriptional regulator|nr:ribbon-helix-helix protein, CopG family [Desulfovibrio sp.]
MSSATTQLAQVVSIRFASDMLARLDEAAAHRACSRSEIIKEAVAGHLDNLFWFDKAVRQGLEDLRANRVASHAQSKKCLDGGKDNDSLVEISVR